ncbi:chemotaxis protein CheD [Rhodobacteraceae bacterium N5(2021)]|uniref:Probable chemoreceptor glutamine deamidase CheD n=2 Tax=Gymnodinialimonas phycosphaerae TaxID=2841589 RepID=A0A975TYU6_9RHOB|nr:chemotaxis protein CheD [Gymnodinialimonas phycosphaerae]
MHATPARTTHVMQGQTQVSQDPNEVLTSILGSCVAACVRDPERRIGGMNHFLLPGSDPRDSGNVRYGAKSMEDLINALLRKGADRRRLEVWLFGGANVLGTQTGVGAANSAFAMEFVKTEGFTLRGSDLGGTLGRRIRFTPFKGTAQVALMQKAPIEKPIARKPSGPDIELF